METLFEGLMAIAFGAAVGVQLYRMVKGKLIPQKGDRIMLISITVGFVIGAVLKFMKNPIPWTVTLYIMGAFLTYTAVLFSIPEKGEER